MVFASFEFLSLFFPLFLLVYAITPQVGRNFVILIFSWFFYAWWSPSFIWVLISITLISWLTGLSLANCKSTTRRKIILAFAIVVLASMLFFYKYANLIVLQILDPLFALQQRGMVWDNVILPIGISFIVLQGISYVTDVYRHTVPAERSFIAFAAYKAMFSQLIAGPIVRYAHVENELHKRVFNIAHIATGLRYFMVGLSMKVIIADTLAPVADVCFAQPNPTFADSWLAAYSYGMQLLFDFAGYSAMAIGIGQMLGFRFPENFDAPYISRTIQDFWRRWHMTLGSWLRDYIYFPLGGSRAAAWRTYFNLMLIMVISGLWHGANSFTFLLWGVMHGVAMLIHRFWSRYLKLSLPDVLAWLVTMIFIFSAWIMFRAPDVSTAMHLYQGQIGLNGFWMSTEVKLVLRPVHLITLIIATIAAILPMWHLQISQLAQRHPRTSDVLSLWPIPATIFAVALMASRGSTPFLYFQF